MSPKSKATPAMRGAFTLIELLVVIAIIVILAGLLLSTAGYIQDKAGRDRATAEIKALESAIEAYKLDNGSYPLPTGADKTPAAKPNSNSDDSTKILIQRLYTDAITDKTKPFVFDKRMLSNYKPNSGQTYEDAIADSYLIDPFGNAYHYEYPGTEDRGGTNYFDLWSDGKKGENSSSDTNLWIKNW